MADSIVPFVRGMKVGLGYDRLAGEPMASPAVAGSSITAIGSAGGRVGYERLFDHRRRGDVHKAVGVTADASGASVDFPLAPRSTTSTLSTFRVFRFTWW